MKRVLQSIVLCGATVCAWSEPIKIACVGNSITWGAAVHNRAFNAYPAVLQRLLGAGYIVENFGVSGRCLLRQVSPSYWNEPVYQSALEFKADWVIIKLGSNDSKPEHWQYKEDFESDLHALLDSFLEVNPETEFVIVLPLPLNGKQSRGHNAEILMEDIHPRIRKVAVERNITLLDLTDKFKDQPQLFADFIHPNADGALVIAVDVYRTLLGFR